MRFLNFGLVALSSLFAASTAAPTVAVGDLATIDINAVKLPSVELLNSRSDNVVCNKLQTTLVEVKKHTSIINATVSGVGQVTEKSKIIVAVKGEVTIIVQLLTTLVGDITVLLSDVTSITGSVKNDVISAVVELLLEILFTLNNVIVQLKISKLLFELISRIHINPKQPSSSSSVLSSLLCLLLSLTCLLCSTSSLLTSSRSSSVFLVVLLVSLPPSSLVSAFSSRTSSVALLVLLAVPSASSVASSAASCKYRNVLDTTQLGGGIRPLIQFR